MHGKILLRGLVCSTILLALVACQPQATGGGDDSGRAASGGWTVPEPSYEGVPAEGEPDYGGVLRRNLLSEPELINPALSTGGSANYVEREVFEYLIDYDRDMEYVGRLAESWKISEDKLTYTFKLRPGLTWHDGEPLTAEDFAFTLDMIREPANRALANASSFALVDRLEVIDELTFEVHYEEVYSPALASWTMQPIPKHIFEPYYQEHGEIRSSPRNREDIVGSGPFRLVEWQPQTALILEAWDGFFDGRPYLDGQTIKLIKTPSVQFQALKAGELDVSTMTPVQLFKQFDAGMREDYKALLYYMWAYSYIGWNGDGSNPFFDDADVRRAMTHLTDRRAIIDKLQSGLGLIPTGPLHQTHWAYPEGLEPMPHDPERAAELLVRAGWEDRDDDGWLDKDGQTFRFEILVGAGSETFQRMAEYLQQEYRRAGIDMQIRNLEWAAFLERARNHEFEAVMLSWSSVPDPHSIYNVWHSTMYDEGRNYVGYDNPEVDRLLDEGMKTFGREKRRPIYAEIHRLINRDQPYTFLLSSPSTVAVHRRFRNVHPSPLGMWRYYPASKIWYVPEELQGAGR